MTQRPFRSRRWAAGAGLVLAAAGAGAAMGLGTAQASESTHSTGPVIVCESGVVDHGNGVETSSAVAVRVPDGTPVPEGCRDG